MASLLKKAGIARMPLWCLPGDKDGVLAWIDKVQGHGEGCPPIFWLKNISRSYFRSKELHSLGKDRGKDRGNNCSTYTVLPIHRLLLAGGGGARDLFKGPASYSGLHRI